MPRKGNITGEIGAYRNRWEPKKIIANLKQEVKDLKRDKLALQQRVEAQERSLEGCK